MLIIKVLSEFLEDNKVDPNVHINDMCRLYEKLIMEDIKNYNGEIFNFGHQNMKIIDIANQIKEIFKSKYNKNIEIKIEDSKDIDLIISIQIKLNQN